MTDTQRRFIEHCLSRYRGDLTGDILPFWLSHGVDVQNGGVFTCLDRDGTVYDTTKSVWFQGRFAYVCSLAYNSGVKDPALLDAARSALNFIDKHCIDSDGHMFFEVTAEGKGLRKRRYVFSECFAAMAMTEYSQAANDRSYMDKALSLFLNIRTMLSREGFLEPKYLTPMRGHSITMIMMNVAHCLGKYSDDPVLEEQIDRSVDEIEKYFLHPEQKAILETVGPDGEFIDTSMGRLVNPGHGIETAWFLMDVAARRDDKHIERLALTILDYSWGWGWDKEYGGIINFRDCRGFPVQDYSQDMKFWWPQCEAMIANLYAYLLTADAKYLERHRQIHEYAYARFPDREYGEWFGYLHRDGSVAQPAKGTLFKGPFHIPRMMIVCGGLCEKILDLKTY